MPLGRKSLHDYAKMSDEDSTSSSNPQERGDRRLDDSFETSRGKHGRLYPELDNENIDEHSRFKYTNSLYPAVPISDDDSLSYAFSNLVHPDILSRQDEGDLETQDNVRTMEFSSSSPKAPPRQRKGAGVSQENKETDELVTRQNKLNEKVAKRGGISDSTDSASQFDKSTQPRQAGTTPISNSTPTVRHFVLLVIISVLALCIGTYFYQWYKTPVSSDQLKLKDFQNKFARLSDDFSKEVHDDSMDRLYGALEHHVQNTLSMKQDKANNYPTCILLAADAHDKKTLDCLADRIAQLVPPKPKSKTSDKSMYVVDLSDKKVNHKNPDEEDLRSRVHHGINQGLNEGANVIVFKHIEILVPSDIPLLELFYSYCDGDNPTFPKTLWVLTLATKNLKALEMGEITRDKKVAKALRLNVEKYLENIIENRPGDAHEQPGYNEKHARNPLLTRIANYIVPVLKTSRTNQCSVLV